MANYDSMEKEIERIKLIGAGQMGSDITKNDEEEKVVVENLRRELKAKHREEYSLQTELCKKLFELNKIDFARKMEKAWLTNEIIRESTKIEILGYMLLEETVTPKAPE